MLPENLEGFFSCWRSITLVSSSAFAECTALKYVFIMMTTGRISDGAFDGCSALTEVFLSNWNQLRLFHRSECLDRCDSFEGFHFTDPVPVGLYPYLLKSILSTTRRARWVTFSTEGHKMVWATNIVKMIMFKKHAGLID